MDQSFQARAIQHLLNLIANKTTDMMPEATSVSVDRYLDPARLERERSVLFRSAPLVVAHASELATPGDFITHDASGAPLLLARTETGARGWLNVCRHRGTRLVREEAGHGRRAFNCPYHAWTYGNDGKLIAVPHDEGFPGILDQGVALARVPVAERFGFIWAAPGAHALDLDRFLAPLETDLVALEAEKHHVHHLESWTRQLNWKLAIESFIEAYHVRVVHVATIAPFFIDNLATHEKLGLHYRGVYPTKAFPKLAEVDRREWKIREVANVLYLLFPNTFVLVQPDHLVTATIWPEALDRTRFVARWLFPTPTTDENRGARAPAVAAVLAALNEDFAIGESIQRGLASGANETLRHGRFEQGLRFFHESVAAALEGPAV